MSQQEDGDDFYAAGRRLAEHIAESSDKDISTATLQALIRDFLPQHEELQEALRSIVARPDFLQLVKHAGSGKGGAQKCASIESLRKIYSTDTVEAADKLVCGMMGLVATATQNKSETETIIVNTLPRQNKAGDRKAARQGENSYRNSPVQPKSAEAAENLSPVPSSHSLRNLSLILVAALTAMGIWVNTQKEAPQVLVDPEFRTSDKIKQEGINQNEVPEVLVDQETRKSDTQTSHKEIGKKFLLSGDYIAAVKELRIAVESNPNDSDAWGNLGLAYAYLENRQEAINAYTSGLQSLTSRGLSESPNLLEMRGHSLLEIGEFTSAISDYTKAIQSMLKREGNDAANSFTYRARAYTKAGDIGAASRDKATAQCLYRLAEITNYKIDYQSNLSCIR